MLTVVFDTNVYVAAALRPGLSEELVRRSFEGQYRPCISSFIISELEQKLLTKAGFPSQQVSQFIADIRKAALLVEPTIEVLAARDPNDNHILACAKTGKATLIISLDQDLLSLKEWEGIPIMHPKTFSWIVQ